jgi:hypothetical protein
MLDKTEIWMGRREEEDIESSLMKSERKLLTRNYAEAGNVIIIVHRFPTSANTTTTCFFISSHCGTGTNRKK